MKKSTAKKTWKCRRKSCATINPSTRRKCIGCGKLKPPKRIPAHKKVLVDLSYEDFIKINGGEFCWIHKAMGLPDPPRTRRLHRDHDHKTGKPRGLLCHTCNRHLKNWVTQEWLLAAAKYLDRDV